MELQRVVLKTVTGQARIAWIVSLSGKTAYVTDSDGVNSIKSGVEPTRQVGFPATDVFLDPDESILDGQNPNWALLRPIEM